MAKYKQTNKKYNGNKKKVTKQTAKKTKQSDRAAKKKAEKEREARKKVEEAKRRKKSTERERAKKEVELDELLMNKMEKYDLDPRDVFGRLEILKDLLDEIAVERKDLKDFTREIYERYKGITAEAELKFEKEVEKLLEQFKDNPDSNLNEFNIPISPGLTYTTLDEYMEAIYRTFRPLAMSKHIRNMDFKIQLDFIRIVRPWEAYQEIMYMGRKAKVFRPPSEVAELAMSRCSVVTNINYTKRR